MSQDENTTPGNRREHLTKSERETIERMHRCGASKGEIARALYRDKSTIKREMKRGSVIQRKRNPYESRNPMVPEYVETVEYFADAGQRVYEGNREKCGSKSKLASCADLVSYVETMVLGAKKWSPDAALGYAKAQGLYPGQEVTTKTLYNWIDAGLLKIKNIDLLLKVRRRPKGSRKERKRKLGKSIEERPAQVESREEFGHWEGDGIVGGGRQGQLITLVERKIGIGLLFNAGSRDSDRMVEIINGLEEEYGSYFPMIFQSITFDNGTEFSDSAAMEGDGRTAVYYAHPYASYERGTNEHWNGLVRRFIPKGSSFDKLTDDTIRRIAHYINTLPRKRFGYRTPLDLWREETKAIMTA